MNDAYRGAIIVVSLAGLYLATRLALAFLPLKARRRIRVHVFWLSLALVATTGIIVSSLAERIGENAPLSWQEWLRLPQVAAIAAGLHPLWAHRRDRHSSQEVPHG